MRLVVAFSLLGFLLAATAQDSVTTKTIEAMQRSVFPVVCIAKKGEEKFETKIVVGTGFFINRKGDFMTAAHVPLDLRWISVKEDCFSAVQLTKVP